MQTLYWRRQSGKVQALEPAPFKSEQEFEATVFATPELFADIFLLKRQVRGGGKPGIPDIVGIDSEGNVCIIEMKNVAVDATVIPQVLKYAIWAQSNPDSIKALWLEAEDRPDDWEIEWDRLEARILVIAPSIDRTTLEHVSKITYPVDLVEVTRWVTDRDSWLLVNGLQPPAKKRVSSTAGMPIYDRDTYKQDHHADSVTGFFRVADQLQNLSRQHGWPVERKFNKFYCGFKVGNFVVFGVKWLGSKSYGIFFKVPEKLARRIRAAGTEFHRYEGIWKQAIFKINDDKRVRMTAFLPLLKAAVKIRSE